MRRRIPSSDITPESAYVSRRALIAAAGLTGGAALAGCGPGGGAPRSAESSPDATEAPPLLPTAAPGATNRPEADELGAPLTSLAAITGYNNYYEFTTQKEMVAERARGFATDPWTVEVGGLVHAPRTFGLEELLGFEQEERIYRLRCVEGWSMVIPWVGFPLRALLERVEPKAEARFVRFQSVFRPEAMPGQKRGGFPWPYVEGLTVDEAMHDLTLLATGLYGRALPPQNGAPVRLVVPWKYGFKSIKAIVRIDLVAERPTSLWMASAPDEYGFYANVNPSVDHPRWSQATERRIEGGLKRIPTLMFNGYEQEVAGLYAGVDLETWF